VSGSTPAILSPRQSQAIVRMCGGVIGGGPQAPSLPETWRRLARVAPPPCIPPHKGEGVARVAPSHRRLRCAFTVAASAAVVALTSLADLALPLPAFAGDLPSGFVYLRDVDPSIRQDIRYAGTRNFLGRPAAGYEAGECILTEPAAKALAEVQKSVVGEQLTLVVFDCFRPIRAVDDFVTWTKRGGPPDPRWFPKVKRSDLIAEGYIGERSSHSRGSTVDVALTPLAGDPAPDADCGATDMNAIDFGTGFDCFDERSRTAFALLSPPAVANRKKLVDAMQAQGFKNYSGEWWHFTLKGEPHKEQRFDFEIESKE
jgi:zinc D-Ala-D-Ala dipeptidase